MSLYSRLDRIAADVEKLNRQVTAVANSPQSQRTSVEGGSIDFNDADGNLKAIVGLQDDGGYTTNVISGPTPPTPANFTVEVDHGKIVVHWDGTFENALVAPTDWARAEVYAQEGQFVTPSRELARGSMVAASGGEVTIGVLKGQWTVCMAGWSQAGIMSPMSEPVTVDVPGYGDIVLAEIDAAETTIKNAGEVLVTEQETLGDKLSEVFGEIDNIIVNGSGAKNFYTPTMPTEGMSEGNLWFDPSDDNKPYIFQGGEWITVRDSFSRPGAAERFASVRDQHSIDNQWSNVEGFSLDSSAKPTVPSGVSGDATIRIALQGSFDSSGNWILDETGVSPNGLPIGIDSQMYVKSSGGAPTGNLVFGLQLPSGNPASAPVPLDVVSGGGAFAGATHQMSVSEAAKGYAEAYGEIAERMWFSVEITLPSAAAGDFVMFEVLSASYLVPSTGIADGAITETKISDDSISTPKLQSKVITTDKIATGAITAESGIIGSLDLGTLTAGSAAIKEAVVQKLFAEVVVAKTAVANEFIGENAILTGAVTAPKITASEELWAKIAQFVQIRAEHIEADAIDGKVITGANIRTSQTGARVQMDVSGLRVFDSSDDQMVQLPSDGTAATFNGELVAQSLTSTGRASFLADNNRLEPGAGLVLAAGVGDPPSPAVVSNHYKQITPPALVDGESVSGLAYGDGLFWRAVDAGSGNNDLDRIEGIDRDGTVQTTIPLVDFWARNGLTVIGDELFALGIRDDRPANVRNQERWVRVFGLDGTYKRQWEYPNYGTGTYQPGIGSTPAGNVSIAQCWQDGKLSWRTFSPTGSLINTTTRDAPVKSDAVGIYGGTADFGATRTVFAKGFTPGTNRQFTVYGTNGNDYFPEQSWYSPGREDVKGLAWDGEKFYSIDPAGVITEYGSLIMGDDSANWWATYRWVGSGGKTTRIAPPARFAWARRSRPRVSAPNIPQGVTTIEPSLALKVTTPARSEFTSPAWVAGDTPATVNYEVLDPYWYVGSPPGDVNNFPNSTPSSVKAASGLFEVRGDGSGRWGPLTFNPDGSMSSSAVPAWVPITAFASGFSAGAFGFAPAYRVWPDGRVEWRGVVSGSFTGTNAVTPFVIPVAARPAQPVNSVAACNIVSGGSEGHVRVEYCADDRPTQLSVYAAGKARSWFALDNLTYYKS